MARPPRCKSHEHGAISSFEVWRDPRHAARWRARHPLPESRPRAATFCCAHDRPAAALGANQARPQLHGAPHQASRRQLGCVETHQLCAGLGNGSQHCTRPDQPGVEYRTPCGDLEREQLGARLARPGLHAGRCAVCAHLAALLADQRGLRQAQACAAHRHAGHGVRIRRALRQSHCRHCSSRHGSRHGGWRREWP